MNFSIPKLYSSLESTLADLTYMPSCLAVGLSGGVDSSMLAVITSSLAKKLGIDLYFFHINHQLQISSDIWIKHINTLGKILNVPIYTINANVNLTSGQGIEAAARKARYKAFSILACKYKIKHILLAHHQDDQAETVLLRLLRGSGPQGMIAMSTYRERDELIYLRPWLNIDRSHILKANKNFSEKYFWSAIKDPMNDDINRTRTVIRVLLSPILDWKWPGWKRVLARHAQQMTESLELLKEIAHSDLNNLDVTDKGRSFSLTAWRNLSHPRQIQVLRYWLSINGAYMPSTARLYNLLRQLRQLHNLGYDRQMMVKHANHHIYCIRGRVNIRILVNKW